MKKISVIVAFWAFSFALYGQVTLSFKPEKGTYLFEMQMDQSITQKMMGMDMTMEQKMNLNYEMAVKNVSDKEIQIRFTFSEIGYLLNSMYLKMEYDSRKPKTGEVSEMDGIMAKLFNVLVGKSLEMKMRPDGSVISLSGMDAIAQEMVKAVSTENGQLAGQVGKALSQQFNDKMWKNTFEQSFMTFPSRPVKKNDSWDAATQLNISGVVINSNNKYTLKDVKGKTGYIDVVSVIEMSPTSETKGKMSGSMSGSIIMDTATGISETSEMTQDISGTMSVNNMEIPMTIKSKIKTSTKKIK
ncbi:MAG: DUF6263 family protein [Bacteroidales bacterium]|jgi:hypothetical protein|nr:DUF6263 family protein [Bacteroidales bacterium]